MLEIGFKEEMEKIIRAVCVDPDDNSKNRLLSHIAFLRLFCKSQFPHKFVNLFFISVIVKDKLTDLWGG